MDVCCTFLVAFTSLICFGSNVHGGIGCIGPDGEPVDWFVAYKIPEIPGHQNPLVRKGLAHSYLENGTDKLTLSDVSVGSRDSCIGRTLLQIYNGHQIEKELVYVMYNDQPPRDKAVSRMGHLKGVLAFDNNQGFWMIHSVPRYPPHASEGYSYPKNGKRNGQSFLCLTVNSGDLNLIAKQLLLANPRVYNYMLRNHSIHYGDKDLWNLIYQIPGSGNDTVAIKTKNGQPFRSFSKDAAFGKELYADWIAPYFRSNLLAETWAVRDPLPSSCDRKYKVENVKKIQLSPSIQFKKTKDHSKWAITANNLVYWTCIGDINRGRGQEKRGGGTVCSSNPALHKAFTRTVLEVEHC